jgi:glycosyltransferase involved in cell wall biosynthesis
LAQIKKRILFCGPSLSGFTGLSYISSSIMKRFQQTGNYDIFYYVLAGVDNKPENFIIFGEDFATMFKNLVSFNGQVHLQQNALNFDSVVENIRPDIVFVVSDVWMIEAIVYSQYRKNFLLFLYATIEADTYPEFAMFPTFFDNTVRKSLKQLFARIDVTIPVTNMAKNALVKMGSGHNVVDNIYNGLDITKRCIRKYTKKEVFGDMISNDSFIFMTVSENSDRKVLDRTISAFNTFLQKVDEKDREKYYLYLHSDFSEIKGGTDLLSVIENYGLQHRVILPRTFLEKRFMTTEELYMRYAVADCYLAFTGGEGMGLGVCESLMHKIPIVYVDYAAPSEYLKEIGFPVKVQTFIHAKNLATKWALCDLDDAAEQMMYVVNNKNIIKNKIEIGFKFVQNNLDWNIIFPKILKVVEANSNDFRKTLVLLKQVI